jgi:hypothetical protein
MSDFLADPPRWKDHRDQASPAERAAGQGFRALEPARPLGAMQVARIAERVSAEPVKRFPWRFCLTATAALLLGGATAASAAYLHLLPRWLTGQPERAATRATEARPHKVKSTTVKPHAAEQPAAPSPAPDSISSEQASHAPDLDRREKQAVEGDGRHRTPLGVQKMRLATSSMAAEPPTPQIQTLEAPAARVLPSPSAISTYAPTQPAQPVPLTLAPPPIPQQPPPERLIALADPAPERSILLPTRRAPSDHVVTIGPDQGAAKHLAEAIRQLRVQHAPKIALGTLARHEADLAQHGLVHEVLLIRVEALLLLDRKAEALRLLDGAQLTGVAGQNSLLLARGELRAAAGRCAEALGDFDRVLAKSNPPDPRALRGRAACSGKQGEAPDKAGAKVR